MFSGVLASADGPLRARLRRMGAIAAAAIILPAAVAKAQAPEPEPYVIGVEDVLEVQMPDHPQLSAKVPVRPDGKISLPLLDDVVAAGLTPVELRHRLVEAYRAFVTVPNLSVLVVEINSRKIFVLGEVTAPGTFPLRSPTRVLQAIALAGGFTPFARPDKVVLLRERDAKQERFKLNLKKVTSGDNVEVNRLLEPGDTVVVP